MTGSGDLTTANLIKKSLSLCNRRHQSGFLSPFLDPGSVYMYQLSIRTDPDFFAMSAAIATAAVLSLPISLSRSSRINSRRGIGFGGGIRVFALLGEEEGSVDKKNPWSTLFEVEDPRSKIPRYEGKFLDAYQALEVVRYDIQYLDWKARQDVRTIMLLHEKVVEVLNPLAREFKSIGTLKKELAELQEELAHAHNQVHISEARVSAAVDKLAYMEALINDKILQERNTKEDNVSAPSTSTTTPPRMKNRQPRRSLNVSGPVQAYNPRLKNFWYPVAFSADLKDDTMVVAENLFIL